MISVRKQLGYVTWVFETLQGSTPFDPTTGPTVAIFRVDPGSGGLALDLHLGSSGLMTVTKVPGYPVGLWAATANFSTAIFEQYWLIGSFLDGTTTRYVRESLYLSDEGQVTYNSGTLSTVAESTQLLPLPTIPGFGGT